MWGIKEIGDSTPELLIHSSQIIPTSRPKGTRERLQELEKRESTKSFESNSDPN